MKKLMSRTLLPAMAAIELWPAIFFPHPSPVLALNDAPTRIQSSDDTAVAVG